MTTKKIKPNKIINKRETSLFESILKINQIIYPDFNKVWVRKSLLKLVNKAKQKISLELSEEEKLNRLLVFFYKENSFYCDQNNYFDSDMLNLEYVLKKHQGMPISLAAIFLVIAKKLEINISPILFPTQFFLRADIDNKSLFLDPWDGSFYNKQQLVLLLKGHFGYGSILNPEFIQPISEPEIAKRLEQIYKSELIREGENIKALTLVETILSSNPKDPYEIRDRGLILASLDCNHTAANDLGYFIEQCPNDPTTQILEIHIQELNAKKQSLH